MSHYIWQDENWPLFTWRNDSLIDSLGECNFRRGKLIGRAASLGLELGQEARAEVLAAEVLQTSAIEGKKLDHDSVRSSVARRLGLPDAGLSRQDRYTEGLVDVLLDATNNYAEPLNIERLHGWQSALFPSGRSGLNHVITGNFRGDTPMQVISGPIGREKIHYEAPAGPQIKQEMVRFLKWWKESKKNTDGILRAAIAGFWFVTIHPYEDGNGRIARALTDMALAQDEKLAVRYYSLSAQIMDEREEYYQVLERGQKGNLDITEWLSWFLDCFTRSIVRSEKIIARVLHKACFWEVHSRTPLTDRQMKVINRLLDAGPGGFVGGLTTRKYVGMTRVSRATAYREITDLVNKKVLGQNSARGRSVSYDLLWPEDHRTVQ